MVKKKEVKKKEPKRISFIVVSLLIIVIIISILDILVSISLNDSVEQENPNQNIIELEGRENFFTFNNSTKVIMTLPAVNDDEEGVNTVLTVEAIPGSGRTLTDIDNLLFWADTQHSMRVARRVAENITGKNVEDYDIIYSIDANASLIGGPSAGAALTIATIAALTSQKMNEKVMITGGINHDGTISPVSAILEKAKAAKKSGATLFLVPLLQSRDVVYEESEHCEFFGSSEVCTTETRPKKINVQEEAGITVKEVETIEDAMQYYFQ